MNFKEKVLSYEKELLDSLSQLIRIESVNSAPQPGKPFGEGCAAALDYILNLGKSMGFQVKNLDNYVGYVEYGEGEEYGAVVAHVDVVPAGPGWNYPPFDITLANDRFYGRGVVDNKGPAIAALYCLKAIKELGIIGKKMRLVFGADEEVGMRDLEYYCKKEPLPAYAFSPDGDYPIYNREKGILNQNVHLTLDDSIVTEISAGTAFNVVPQAAFAIVTDNDIAGVNKALETYNAGCEFKITAQAQADGTIRLTATGKAAHAKQPHQGFNAGLNLSKFILEHYGEKAGKAFEYIKKYIGMETAGESMGVAFEDTLSGKLTLNVGKFVMEENGFKICIDIRYPITDKGERLIEAITQTAVQSGFTSSLHNLSEPLYVPEDKPIIKILSAAYEEATGEKAELCVTGGGTYARKLHNTCVSFGMGFEDGEKPRYHESDEHFYLPEFRKHLIICANAMMRMITG